MKNAFPKSLSSLVLILFCAQTHAAGELLGIWMHIAWAEEGVYNGESYSGLVVLDSIEYVMEVDSHVCTAYATHEGRVYSMHNSFRISNDSIYSEALEIPLLWERNGDTLSTTMHYEEGDDWETVTFTFLSMPTLQFPENWPSSSVLYEPYSLSPFGPFSFGTGPGNPKTSTKRRVDKPTIGGINAAPEYYRLNGRVGKSPAGTAVNILLVPGSNGLVTVSASKRFKF